MIYWIRCLIEGIHKMYLPKPTIVDTWFLVHSHHCWCMFSTKSQTASRIYFVRILQSIHDTLKYSKSNSWVSAWSRQYRSCMNLVIPVEIVFTQASREVIWSWLAIVFSNSLSPIWLGNCVSPGVVCRTSLNPTIRKIPYHREWGDGMNLERVPRVAPRVRVRLPEALLVWIWNNVCLTQAKKLSWVADRD